MDEILPSKMDEILKIVIRTRIAELEERLLDCHTFVETSYIDDEIDELRQLLEGVPSQLTWH